jgi:DNA-binding NarL/FixJ family response regulator
MINLPTGSNLPKAAEVVATTVVTETKVPNVTGRDIAPSKPIKTTRLQTTSPTQLTTREEEVRQLLRKGLRIEVIGGMLQITTKTVKFHKTRIYRKLGVTSITQFLVSELNRA